MRKKSILQIFIPIMVLILAACGASGPSTSIKVAMTDFSFSPNKFTVLAGQQISLQINNEGGVAHSFIIMKAGKQVQAHFVDADKANVYWEQASVDPGKSIKVAFTAPTEPGDYQIVCGISGHFEAGMVAKLTVVNQP